MADEQAGSATDAGTAQGGVAEKEKRDRSLIDFPYVPLEAALEVARALYERCGFGSCDQDELAAQMDQTLSGAFRQKTSAARTFGLVDKDGRSAFRLSDLGKRIVSSEGEQAAKVDAFLHVPLYLQIYEKFRGHNLPPSKALEREMESLGVARKQTDRARQAFERSALFAGFSDSGKDRLVRPRIEASSNQKSESGQTTSDPKRSIEEPTRITENPNSNHNPIAPSIDPIIKGLIDKLPPPGAVWPKSKRKLWLQILENSLELVYEDDPPAEINRNPT